MEYSLSWGLSKTGLPLIVVTYTGDVGELKNLCFLIDTGSTHNVLFDFVYNHLKRNFKSLNNKQNIMGIEGKCKETSLIEVSFNFEGTDYTSIFSVLNASDAVKQVQDETGIQIHGVLGVQFLIENKWIIDFKYVKVIHT